MLVYERVGRRYLSFNELLRKPRHFQDIVQAIDLNVMKEVGVL
jgi:hypothetical protein